MPNLSGFCVFSDEMEYLYFLGTVHGEYSTCMQCELDAAVLIY